MPVTTVLLPEFPSSSRIVNALANHNRLAGSIVTATADVFNPGGNAC